MARGSAYHHGQLPDALRAAALRLVAERGPAGFTMKDAAAAAEVSVAAPYRHFTDRDDLLRSAAVEGYRRLVEDFEARDDADPADRLGAMMAAFVRWAADHTAAHQILFVADVRKAEHPQLAALGDRAFTALLRAAQEAAGDHAAALVVSAYAIAQGHALIADDPSVAASGLIDPARLPDMAARAVRALARDLAAP
jgi:AcrR family transcriptional regulator